MTIDITIGKLVMKNINEVLLYQFNEYWTMTREDSIKFIDFFDVEICPIEDDGCTTEDTFCPGKSYRSGSILGMVDFFRTVAPELIMKIRPISNNDRQISKLKPHIEEINKLEYNGGDELHKKRLQWFKFWCNKAVELYGDLAAIEFT